MGSCQAEFISGSCVSEGKKTQESELVRNTLVKQVTPDPVSEGFRCLLQDQETVYGYFSTIWYVRME